MVYIIYVNINIFMKPECFLRPRLNLTTKLGLRDQVYNKLHNTHMPIDPR